MKQSCNDKVKCATCSDYIKHGTPCVNCEGTSCESVYYTSCVIYDSDDLECFGVNAGSNLTDLIIKLLESLYPECTTTTTTVPVTTTTTTQSSSTTTTTTIATTSTTTRFRICHTCP